jgi:hypothetical protein
MIIGQPETELYLTISDYDILKRKVFEANEIICSQNERNEGLSNNSSSLDIAPSPNTSSSMNAQNAQGFTIISD